MNDLGIVLELSVFGWNEDLESAFRESEGEKLLPARVLESNGLVYKLVSERGSLCGRLSGRFRHDCSAENDYPTVGDWVAFKPNVHSGSVSIVGMLERKSRFSRKKVGGSSDEQVIAANIDTIFIVSGLDENYSIRRLERYVALAADSGAELVFILNKADLCEDRDEKMSEIKRLFPDVPAYALSAIENRGLEQLSSHINAGKTIVFLGSSGAGKSTIINRLLGEDKQRTGDVSSHHGKGRHTTTSKNMILLPDGAIVIDTPGLREVALLCSGEGVKNAFADIDDLASGCKYKSCTHTNEPGCAVLKALEDGVISEDRLESFRKLTREIAYNLTRHEAQSKNKRSKFKKYISKQAKIVKKERERYGL